MTHTDEREDIVGQADTLVKLQETDLAEVRARKRLDELPEKRAILETRKKRREVEDLRGRAENYLAGLERDIARHEDETAALDEKLEHEQAKVMSGEVVNPKELQNLTREMDALKRRKDKLEMESLQVMEKVEKAKEQIAKIDDATKSLDAREEKLGREFKEKGGELQTEIDHLHREREALAAALQPDLRKAYEDSRASKTGVGAGVLTADACSACRVQLPSQQVSALRAGPDVGRCPNCGRLLVVRREDES